MGAALGRVQAAWNRAYLDAGGADEAVKRVVAGVRPFQTGSAGLIAHMSMLWVAVGPQRCLCWSVQIGGSVRILTRKFDHRHRTALRLALLR